MTKPTTRFARFSIIVQAIVYFFIINELILKGINDPTGMGTLGILIILLVTAITGFSVGLHQLLLIKENSIKNQTKFPKSKNEIIIFISMILGGIVLLIIICICIIDFLNALLV